MTTIDWNAIAKDAEDVGTFDPLPDGDYNFVVAECKAATSASGKAMLKIKAQVSDGPHAKRLVWDNLVLTTDNPKALGFFFSKLAALGFQKDWMTANSPSMEQLAQMIAGRPFRAKVGRKTYQGTESNELKNYYPAQATTVPGAPVPPPAAAQAAPPPPPAPAPATAAAPPPPPAAATEPALAAPAAPPAPF